MRVDDTPGKSFAERLGKMIEPSEDEKKIAILTKALEFYGDQQSWCDCKIAARDHWIYSELDIGYVEMFGGKIARKALAEIKEME